MRRAAGRSPVVGFFAAVVRPVLWGSDVLSEAVDLLIRSVQLGTWAKQPIRAGLVRQLRSCGVETLPVVMIIALLAGLGTSQAMAFLAATGSASVAAQLGGAYLFESATLAVAIVVLIRSGAVDVVELATVRASGQDRMLLTHGIDPFSYLVLPRALGLALSSVALVSAFVTVALATTSVVLLLDDSIGVRPSDLLRGTFEPIDLSDTARIVINSTVPAGLTGLIACRVGLSVDSALAEIPRVLPRYASQALLTTVAVSITASVLL